MKLFLFVLLSCALFAAEDISGFWKKLDDNGKPQCVFGFYEYESAYYGRLIGSYDENGKMTDTIYNPVGRAEGVVGNPFMCGLDILYSLYDQGSRFAGTIIDPENGKSYNCEVWHEGEKVIVRGKVMMFGRNLPPWYPAEKSDFPKGFKLPDMKKFVPEIPQLN
jgi:uncharacterized protein (DUF2147 family)